MKHIPTGLTVRSESERSQYRNKQLALQLLTSRLKMAEEAGKKGELASLCGGRKRGHCDHREMGNERNVVLSAGHQRRQAADLGEHAGGFDRAAE